MEQELLGSIARGSNPGMVSALLLHSPPELARKAYDAACAAHDLTLASAASEEQQRAARAMIQAVLASLPPQQLEEALPMLEPASTAALIARPAAAGTRKRRAAAPVDLQCTTDPSGASSSDEDADSGSDSFADSDSDCSAAARSSSHKKRQRQRHRQNVRRRRLDAAAALTARGCQPYDPEAASSSAAAAAAAFLRGIQQELPDDDADAVAAPRRRRPSSPTVLRRRRGRARGGVPQPALPPQPLNLLDFQVPHYRRVCAILQRTSRFFDPSVMGAGKTYILLKYCLEHNLPLVYTGPSAMRSKMRKLCRLFGVQMEDFMSWNRLRGQQGRVSHDWLVRTDTEHTYTNSEGVESSYTTTSYAQTQALLDLVQRGAVFAFDECQHGKNDGNQNEAAATIASAVYGNHIGDGTTNRVTPSSVFLLSATPIDKPEQAYTFARMLGLLQARSKKRLYTTSGDDVLVEGEGIWPFVQWCRAVNPQLTEQLLEKLNDRNDDNALDEWDDEANDSGQDADAEHSDGEQDMKPAFKQEPLHLSVKRQKIEPAAAAAASSSQQSDTYAASQRLARLRMRELMADEKQQRPFRRFNRFVLRLVAKVALTELSHAMPCNFGIHKDIKSGYYQFASQEDLALYTDGVELLKKALKFSEEEGGGDAVSSEPNWKDLTEALQRIERAKVGILIRLARIYLRKHPNNKIVLFTNFHDSLDQLEEALAEFKPLRLDGKVPEHKRSERVEKFQAHNTDHRLLISTMRVGGVGIDLHDTHGDFPRFAFVVPDFHIQNCHQAPGRFVRAGGKSAAFIRFVFGLPWLEDDVDPTRHLERNEFRIWRALCLKSNVLKTMARQQILDGFQFAIDLVECRETHRETATTIDVDLSVMDAAPPKLSRLARPPAAAAAHSSAPFARPLVPPQSLFPSRPPPPPAAVAATAGHRGSTWIHPPPSPPAISRFMPFAGQGHSMMRHQAPAYARPLAPPPPPARSVQTHAIPGRPNASFRDRLLHHASQQARLASRAPRRKLR